jgi:patatin-like phospholipase/acyl hydrolase
LNHSLYKRDLLEKIMKEYLGEVNIKDALTDELLVVAYDYNSQQPRMFSKYFSQVDPAIYDVPIGDATGASSAAPTFFDPKT